MEGAIRNQQFKTNQLRSLTSYCMCVEACHYVNVYVFMNFVTCWINGDLRIKGDLNIEKLSVNLYDIEVNAGFIIPDKQSSKCSILKF
jgi:hypothetical protein